MKKTILHITAGNDTWTPTTKEQTAIANKFKRAMQRATPNHVPVVVTRDGVQAQVVEYDPAQYATTGYVTTYTNNSAPQAPSLNPGQVTC